MEQDDKFQFDGVIDMKIREVNENKKQWKPSPTSSIVKSPQPTIKQDRHPHCL